VFDGEDCLDTGMQGLGPIGEFWGLTRTVHGGHRTSIAVVCSAIAAVTTVIASDSISAIMERMKSIQIVRSDVISGIE
jgi:hypothetical protein